jgi:hypothetical protein
MYELVDIPSIEGIFGEPTYKWETNVQTDSVEI